MEGGGGEERSLERRHERSGGVRGSVVGVEQLGVEAHPSAAEVREGLERGEESAGERAEGDHVEESPRRKLRHHVQQRAPRCGNGRTTHAGGAINDERISEGQGGGEHEAREERHHSALMPLLVLLHPNAGLVRVLRLDEQLKVSREGAPVSEADGGAALSALHEEEVRGGAQ